MIGSYFNDKKINPCGICDNCINNENDIIPAEEFKMISENILKLLKTSHLHIRDVDKNFKQHKKKMSGRSLIFSGQKTIILSDKEGNLVYKMTGKFGMIHGVSYKIKKGTKIEI